MTYADKADQRRADLAYYHRNAEVIAERRALRRAAVKAIRDAEIEALRKQDLWAHTKEKRAKLKIEKEIRLALLARGEHSQYAYQITKIDSDGNICGWSDVFETIRRDGSRGALWDRSVSNYVDVTLLNTCDLCGKFSTPKKINNRDDCYNWNRDPGDYETPTKYMLCMACWNKVRPIAKRRKEIEECAGLLRKLKRQITEANRMERNHDRPRTESATQ